MDEEECREREREKIHIYNNNNMYRKSEEKKKKVDEKSIFWPKRATRPAANQPTYIDEEINGSESKSCAKE